MIEKENRWILPDRQKKQEIQDRTNSSNKNFEDFSIFESYSAYKKNPNSKFLKNHGISTDSQATEYLRSLKIILKQYKIIPSGNLLDVGCGVGILTNKFKELNFNVFGIDISRDAIIVARKTYKEVKFFFQSADDIDNFSKLKFNFIHAKEFYPFSRTDDIKNHLYYFEKFSQILNRNGYIILSMSNEKYGFGNVSEKMNKKLNSIGYKKISEKRLIPIGISKVFLGIEYLKPIYNVIIQSLLLMGKSRFRYIYIYQKYN